VTEQWEVDMATPGTRHSTVIEIEDTPPMPEAARAGDGGRGGDGGRRGDGARGLGRLGLPITPTRAVWWGGLAVATAIGVLELPVAAAIAAGAWVAERGARSVVKRASAGDGSTERSPR
jgi:hypothetical protein